MIYYLKFLTPLATPNLQVKLADALNSLRVHLPRPRTLESQESSCEKYHLERVCVLFSEKLTGGGSGAGVNEEGRGERRDQR